MAVTVELVNEREYAFTERDFGFFAKIAKEQTGIVLGEPKRDLVYSRLVKRVRSLELSSFADYRTLIGSASGEAELGNMINAITTNLTKFFREGHHFEHLKQNVFEPALAEARKVKDRKLRIWSAGSSSGQEAYSIAMTLADTIAGYERWDARILATDLDTNMLGQGNSAVYPADGLVNISEDFQQRFMSPAQDGGASRQFKETIRKMVTFKRLNLMSPWPLKQRYDAIFCRNVVIYFDRETTRWLVQRLVQQLKIGGFLYLGHSESLLKPSSNLQLAGRTTYERIE